VFKLQKVDPKKGSKIKGRLKQDPHYQCPACIAGPPHKTKADDTAQILLDQDCTLECVDSFCYLGDMIGAGGVQKRHHGIE